MKYVVIQSGGKQYRVSEGDTLEIEHLAEEKDQKIIFNEILLYANDGLIKVGKPFVSGITVDAIIIEHFRGDKIRVAKFKAKSRYRKVTGHRQSLTKIKIEAILDSKEHKNKEIIASEKVTTAPSKSVATEKAVLKKPGKETTKLKTK
jgi:large subunit ribosomal protein L21